MGSRIVHVCDSCGTESTDAAVTPWMWARVHVHATFGAIEGDPRGPVITTTKLVCQACNVRIYDAMLDLLKPARESVKKRNWPCP